MKFQTTISLAIFVFFLVVVLPLCRYFFRLFFQQHQSNVSTKRGIEVVLYHSFQERSIVILFVFYLRDVMVKLDIPLFHKRINFSLWQCTSPKIMEHLRRQKEKLEKLKCTPWNMVSQEDTLSLFEDEVDDEVKKMWHFGRWGIVLCQNEHSCKSRIR